MCGITGIFAFNLVGKFHKIHVTAATQALERRGPDFQDVYLEEWVALGHRRLSIIDTTDSGNQPMWDPTSRYGIVFNGEIFNFAELRQDLEHKGISFKSHSDTEVLLHLLIREGTQALPKLNGFFAFCFYDRATGTMLLARDRYGIKPLLYLFDEDKFLFASEMKSLLCYGIEKQINTRALQEYLEFNYSPGTETLINGVQRLAPGTWLKVSRGQQESGTWYSLEASQTSGTPPGAASYTQATTQLAEILEDAVRLRLVADVPLGCFLSGGLDSSIIAALAVRHKPDLQTFSIGFRDDDFFDETRYATAVAQKIGADHTVFRLTHQDFLSHIRDVLAYCDEPFADSSAIAVYILAKETRKRVTVALSGDGADELFAGYNKHAALLKSLQPGWKENGLATLLPLLRLLPQSRHGWLGNKIRQAVRFGSGVKLSPAERYRLWASITPKSEVEALLLPAFRAEASDRLPEWEKRIADLDRHPKDFNAILRADQRILLPGDMLTKVDWMSMANSLEVRVPFLDYRVVDFANSLPGSFKIQPGNRKRILKDSFGTLLPQEIYTRPKKGFEVPLLKWLRTEFRHELETKWLAKDFIREQGIFDPVVIDQYVKKLFSGNPGDIHARIWALVVFQNWYLRIRG